MPELCAPHSKVKRRLAHPSRASATKQTNLPTTTPSLPGACANRTYLPTSLCFESRATHARALLTEALATMPYRLVLVRVGERSRFAHIACVPRDGGFVAGHQSLRINAPSEPIWYALLVSNTPGQAKSNLSLKREIARSLLSSLGVVFRLLTNPGLIIL